MGYAACCLVLWTTDKERKLHHEEVCLLRALCVVGALPGCYGVCFNRLQFFNDCDFRVSYLVRSRKVFREELALYLEGWNEHHVYPSCCGSYFDGRGQLCKCVVGVLE